MNLKEFFKPTWKKIVLFLIISFLYVWISLYNFPGNLYSYLHFLNLPVEPNDLYYIPSYFVNYALSCLLIYFWNRFRGIEGQKKREYETGMFFGILLNLLTFFLEICKIYIFYGWLSLITLINTPFYFILESGWGYHLGCILNLSICSDEGSILFWSYLTPLLSGIIYGGIIGFLVYIIRGKDDKDRIKKLRKITLIVITILVLMGLMFSLFKLYEISNGCDYKKVDFEMRVYDSQGRVTGVINGVEYMDISDSYLVGGEVMIFHPKDTYVHEIHALTEGNYVFSPSSTKEGEEVSFNAINIPISSGETHRYNFDWVALARGEEGAIVLIDENNDGIFEKNITSELKLTCEEFKLKTNKTTSGSIFFLKILFIAIALILIIISIFVIIKIIKYKGSDFLGSETSK